MSDYNRLKLIELESILTTKGGVKCERCNVWVSNEFTDKDNICDSCNKI